MTANDPAAEERRMCVEYIEFRANRARAHDVKVALLVLASDLAAELHLPEGLSNGQDQVG
jgi:hypothetical protein